MRIFKAIIESAAWSPMFTTDCPYCSHKMRYYTQLNGNECKWCHKQLPFPSSMVKSAKKRVEYHVDI